MKRVALVTHNVTAAGGTRSLTNFLYSVLERSGRYEPHVISLAGSASDASSMLLRAPRSWRRGARVDEGVFRDVPYRHVGAWAAELEFQRYRPRRVLTELLDGFDLVQFATGVPAWAHSALRSSPPVLLWAATTIEADRESQLHVYSGARRLWSSAMTRFTAHYERRALQGVNTVFALSEYTQAALEPMVGSTPLLLAPCGVDTERFRPSVAPTRDYLLGVARFHDPRKNISLLLRSYARVVAARPEVPDLYLVGETPTEAAGELTRSLGIEGRVRFLGVQPLPRLIELFQNARCFVLSSDEEGLGIVVLEALACGTPVISTACGGPETAIKHEYTGLLTRVGDEEAMVAALTRLLDDPALESRLRSVGRAVAEASFSLETTGQVFLDRYDEVLSGGAATSTGWRPIAARDAGSDGDAEGSGPAKLPEAPVTVVIPFFNGHGTILRVLRSIDRQTLRPAEVIIVDDGSDEAPPLGALATDLPLRIIRHETNRGIAAARNTGIRAASHDWIAFIDHDDEWMPHKLERQWPLAASCPDPETTAFFGRCLWNEPAENKREIFPGSSVEAALACGGEEALIALLRQGMTVPFITLLSHRSLFERFGYLDESVRGGSDDYEFVLRLAAGGVRFLSDDFGSARRYSAIYHMGTDNHSRGPWFLSEEHGFLRDLARGRPHLQKHMGFALARSHFRAGRIFERRAERFAAAAEYRSAILLRPSSLRPRLALLALRTPDGVKDRLEIGWRKLRTKIQQGRELGRRVIR
jgi:D-inositol-3-phosphate glycosyltransferase